MYIWWGGYGGLMKKGHSIAALAVRVARKIGLWVASRAQLCYARCAGGGDDRKD